MHQKRHLHDIIVRRLHSADQDSICDHFQRLDARSRRARFCGTTSDLCTQKYARSIFRHDSIVCGAFIDGQLRGVAELHGAIHSWPATGEAAFSVEADWQNIGIGDALFERMFAMAQNRGVRTIQMMCLKENNRMKHLAAKHHAQLLSDRDAVEAVLYHCWPTPLSMAKEFIGETKGYAHMLFG